MQRSFSSVQAFSCHSLSVPGKGLPSLIKHQGFVCFCFLPERGSGERPVTSHHTGSREGLRTLGSFHRTLHEMARYGDPRGHTALGGSGLPSSSFHHSTGIEQSSGPPTGTCLSVAQVSTVTTRDFPKEMGPIPSSCLSFVFFLKPQTDGFTVKMRAKKR